MSGVESVVEGDDSELDWTPRRLGDLVSHRKGFAFKRSQYRTEGRRIIRASNFTDGSIEVTGSLFMDSEEAANFEDYSLRDGDVVLATVGSWPDSPQSAVGRVIRVPLDVDGSLLNQNTVRLRSKLGLGQRYLYYLLRDCHFRNHLLGCAQGSANQCSIKLSDIFRFESPLPPLDEQRRIAAVLGALDDKIELNRKMNRTLEEMAQAIFRSWFIDFDGVPESEMVESEIGLIPNGWEAGTIGEQFELTMGMSPPGHTYNEDGDGLPFFQGARDFDARFPTERVYCTEPKRTANALDTLVSVRAPVGRPNIAWRHCCIGRGVAALRHKTGSRSYTYAVAKHLEHRFEKFNAEGTVFGSINKRDFLKMPVVVPPPSVVERFDTLVAPMDDRIRNASFESRTLASLRDALLPKLMTGEIRVPEAEKAVEAVA